MNAILNRLLTRQWPFWLGGLFVGLAEIVFYIRYEHFIPVTTGLAKMFAVSEQHLFGLDWLSRVYAPGIHWVIIGAVLGAWLVARMEGESRSWVRYDRRMLALAFVGGIIFSFGTRLAAGCTTHHFLGGIPAMSIASWTVLLTGIPFAFLAFKIVLKLGLGAYFYHQETLNVAAQNPEHHPGYDPEYQPNRDPLRLLLLGFAGLLLFMPLGFAVFGQIDGSLSQYPWLDVAWQTAAGLLLGLGIAKSGLGTECAAMAPESCFTTEKRFCSGGGAACSFRMFRGMLPLQGLMTAVVVFNLVILGSWLWLGGTIPNAAGRAGLYWGHIVGGPLLAMGAVFMIGCEVRTYGRLGLGYGTALAALPGFYVGYLPYTLYKESMDAVFMGEGLTYFLTVPEWAAYTLGGGETLWAVLYTLVLIGILTFSLEAGRRYFRTRLRTLLVANTDELTERDPLATGTP